jgi:hypothetical protein
MSKAVFLLAVHRLDRDEWRLAFSKRAHMAERGW